MWPVAKTPSVFMAHLCYFYVERDSHKVFWHKVYIKFQSFEFSVSDFTLGNGQNISHLPSRQLHVQS